MGKRANRVGASDQFDDIRVTGGYAPTGGSEQNIGQRSPPPTKSDDPAMLEDDIEQTRVELGETVEAIQDRLAPDRLADNAKDTAQDVVELAIKEAKAAVYELTGQAKEAVREATVGRVERMASSTGEAASGFSSTVVTTIKRNPGPAALTALGIGWLVVSGSSAKSGGGSAQVSTNSSGPGALSQAQEQASQLADQAQGIASDAGGQVQEQASHVSSQVQDAASRVSQQAQQKAGQVAAQSQRIPSWFRRLMNENPLPLGVAAVALGSVAAFAVPETQRENQLLGQARDSAIDQAQMGAEQMVNKVQSVADEAQEAAEKEAKYQGLTESS